MFYWLGILPKPHLLISTRTDFGNIPIHVGTTNSCNSSSNGSQGLLPASLGTCGLQTERQASKTPINPSTLHTQGLSRGETKVQMEFHSQLIVETKVQIP